MKCLFSKFSCADILTICSLMEMAPCVHIDVCSCPILPHHILVTYSNKVLKHFIKILDRLTFLPSFVKQEISVRQSGARIWNSNLDVIETLRVSSIHQAKHTVPVERPTFSLSIYQSVLWKFSLFILVVLLCLFIFHIHSLQNMI